MTPVDIIELSNCNAPGMRKRSDQGCCFVESSLRLGACLGTGEIHAQGSILGILLRSLGEQHATKASVYSEYR